MNEEASISKYVEMLNFKVGICLIHSWFSDPNRITFYVYVYISLCLFVCNISSYVCKFPHKNYRHKRNAFATFYITTVSLVDQKKCA